MDEQHDGRLPDWIIIGAMKCATSSLHTYLSKHPSIATSTPKELDFFLPERYAELGIDWYRQQFLDPPGAAVAGESSVNYTKRHLFDGVPQRMHQHLPDVKLIYVVRDPIKRIESEWIHSVGAGKWRGDFASAIADLETSPMVQTSRYWTQLSEFLAVYPAEQVKVMSYDDISKTPRESVNEVLEFLGLEPDFDDPMIGKKVHPSSRKMRPNRLGLLFWEDQVRRRRIRKYLRRLVASPIEQPVWTDADRARVIEYLQPEVDGIRNFSGLDFADWPL
ncbi:MAG: sulfotransferase domain-containing protein [Ilumatobacter sp.]